MKIAVWKEKYKNIPPPIKASFWFMVMNILQKGIQFLVTPIYTRLLTTEEYGYYSVYSAWNSFLSVLATLNLSAGVFNTGMLKYEGDQRRFISSMQGLGNVATMLFFSAIFLLCDEVLHWIELEPIVLIGLWLQLLVAPAFHYWSNYQKYQYKYGLLSIATLFMAIATPVSSLLFIKILPERKYAVVFGSMLVQTVIGLFFYVVNWYKGKSLYVKEYWSFAFKFNFPLIPHYLSSMILGQADRIMISRYCGQDRAGIYSLSYTISLMLSLVTSAVTSTYAPWTYRQLKKKEYQKINQMSNYLLVGLGGIVICGILVAPELILFLGTKEYLEAKWIIPPVMLGTYFTMVYCLFGNVEFYHEKNISIMFASVMAAIANVFLNAICIPKFGFIAAGYTTLICYILLTLFHYFSMKNICKKEGIQGVYHIKFIFFFSVALILVSFLVMLTYNITILRYGIILLGIILCFLFRKKLIKTVVDKIQKN